MTFKISPKWRAGMELECSDRRGQQVYCTTRDPGLEWIDAYDDLPPGGAQPAGALSIQPLPHLRRYRGRAGGGTTTATLHYHLSCCHYGHRTSNRRRNFK